MSRQSLQQWHPDNANNIKVPRKGLRHENGISLKQRHHTVSI